MATIEYAAIVVVVSLALAVGGAVVSAGGIPRAVASQLARAFCLVSGGDCLGDDGPVPCVRSAAARTREKRLGAVFAKLADGRTVVQEHRSDGTVVVTVADMGEALGGVRIPGVGSGKIGARLSAGRRFVVAGAAAARRLVSQLDEDRLPVGEVGRGLARFLTGGVERFARFGTRGEAVATLKGLGLGPRAEAIAGLAMGVRVDGATGRQTIELSGDRALFAAVAAPVVRAAGGVERAFSVELTQARGGDPLSLVIRRDAEVHGEIGFGAGRASGGTLLEAEARLDLTDPAARALASAFLDRARHADAGAFAAAHALAERLGQQARIDIRLYATDRDERKGGASFQGVGYETIDRTETARLVDAAGRDPGRGWSRRLDCVGIA